MKYPAIYKSVEGSEYLYQNKDSYYCYERQLWDSSEPHHDCHHSDTNITAEYLANTYGEVKSKEHAEFIEKLCENAGINVFPQLFDANHFVIKGGLSFHNCESIKSSELKQITIPLPPEYGGIEVNNNSEFNFVDCSFENNTVNRESEFPKVGDDVVLMSGKGKVVALPDNHGNYVIVTDKGFYLLASKDEIKKPKTPEQELRDDILDFEEFAITENKAMQLARWLNNQGYNKKPQ